MRHGVRSDGEAVTIRNRWKALAVPVSLLVLIAGGGVVLGVWVDRRGDRASPFPFVIMLLMAAGAASVGRWLNTRRRRTLVLDRDGIRMTPSGLNLGWDDITMVRAVFVPGVGDALAIVAGGWVSMPPPTITVRKRRLRTIRDACGPLSVLHPGVFRFDLLDEPTPRFPSADYIHRFSPSSTQLLAAGREVPPVSARSRWLRRVLIGLTVALHGGLLVWQTASDESSSAPTTTFHFEMTPAMQLQIDRLTADSDLCHGIWMAPGAWPPDVEVTTIRYLRGDTEMWTLTAPATGAVSFLHSGDLPSYSVNDIIESYGYTFVGTFTSTPFPAGDRLMLESPGRRLEVTCAEI